MSSKDTEGKAEPRPQPPQLHLPAVQAVRTAQVDSTTAEFRPNAQNTQQSVNKDGGATISNNAQRPLPAQIVRQPANAHQANILRWNHRIMQKAIELGYYQACLRLPLQDRPRYWQQVEIALENIIRRAISRLHWEKQRKAALRWECHALARQAVLQMMLARQKKH